MGRIVDLCTEMASVVEEGPEGLVLPLEAREQFLESWPDEDLDDALNFVTESMLQSELVEAMDSLSSRLLEVLGAYGEEKAFAEAVAGEAKIDIGAIRQIAHRLARVEEILDVFREEAPPDRQRFDALQKRLLDQGIEDDMRPEWDEEPPEAWDDDEPDEPED
jgi:uncharacterized protein with von Willebrand factor type A (vWA) domain